MLTLLFSFVILNLLANLEALFAHFKKAPNSRMDIFTNYIIFSCHIEPTLPKIIFLWLKLWHLELGALFTHFKRAPKLIKKGHFHKLNFRLSFWTHLPKIMVLWPKLWHLKLGALCALFAHFKRAPKLTKNWHFHKLYLFSIFFCHIEHICQKLCFYDQNCYVWSMGPFLPLLKGPPNSPKTDIFKIYIFLLFPIVTFSLHTKNYMSMPRIVTFGLWALFFNGPLKGAKMQKFKNSWNHIVILL